MTQAEFAEALGLDQSSVAKLETNGRASADTLFRLRRQFPREMKRAGVTTDDALAWNRTPPRRGRAS